MADPNQQSTMLSSSLQANQDSSQLRDPFVKAQQQYQDKLGDGSLLSSTQIQSPQQPPGMNSNSMPNTGGVGTQPQAQMLYNPSSDADYAKFNSSPLPDMLKKIGINDQGLAMNDIGKAQLIGRFKSKFGETYSSAPQFLDAIKAFDTHLNTIPQDSMKQSVAGGQRTLGALLGG